MATFTVKAVECEFPEGSKFSVVLFNPVVVGERTFEATKLAEVQAAVDQFIAEQPKDRNWMIWGIRIKRGDRAPRGFNQWVDGYQHFNKVEAAA